MNTFESMKNDLLTLNRNIHSLFVNAKMIPGITAFPFEDGDKISRTVEEQIREDVLRVAVVGAIKSGKSTFVNAFLGGDYLKRGAGVVTSIVTRVRKGEELEARLDFKSFQEVNGEINEALVLFPALDDGAERQEIDIRREKDRESLAALLASLNSDRLLDEDSLDSNVVLLSSCLKGYDRVKDILAWDEKIQHFKGDEFEQHRDFVGDDSLSVYLRDVELRIPRPGNLDDNMEIADCQGSDSTNPLHLAMIQDYLLRTHLILYLVSSRTGIRQADLKFLSMIRKMGLLENIFFVVNVDFNEHESVNDLRNLIDRVREDLAVIREKPDVFAYSTLYDLLRKEEKSLSAKETARLKQWDDDGEMASYSEGGRRRFETLFREKLTRDRVLLLLNNHVERLGVAVTGLSDWVNFTRDLLTANRGNVRDIVDRIRKEQDQVNRMTAMIRDTLDGTSQKIKGELQRDIDGFLDPHFGEIVKGIQAFIRKESTPYGGMNDDIEGMGFSATLYKSFQHFKRSLDLYMAETVNPRLVQFIRQEEKKAADRLAEIAGPYQSMVRDTLERYEETLKKAGGTPAGHPPLENFSLNPEVIRRQSGLTVPPLATSLHYSARIRTEAIVRLGFYNVLSTLKRWFRRQDGEDGEGARHALDDSLKRIRRETERSVVFHMGSYRENLKYQYIFKLVDLTTNFLYDRIRDRFRGLTADLSDIEKLVDQEKDAKEKTLGALASLEAEARGILGHLQEIRTRMTTS